MAQRLFTVLSVLLLAAVFAVPAWSQEATAACVEQYDADTNYFPDQVETEYTEGFTVEYFNNYKLVTVLTPYPGAEETFQYALVQCGTPIPDDLPEEALVIEVPVQSIVTMSTTYLPALDVLGVTETIVGMDELDYVNTLSIRERIDSGEVVEAGSGSGVNIEALLELEPDLIMMQSFGSPDFDAAPVLVDAGLPVVINGDWVDTNPLGRAEWITFIGGRYAFNRTLEYWHDEAAFTAALAQAAHDPAQRATYLQQAADLYHGDLALESLDSEVLLVRREQMRQQAMNALLELGALHLAAGMFSAAADTYRRAITLDSYLEAAHRGLLRALAHQNERGLALAHYQSLQSLLHHDLGVDPDHATRALAVAINRGDPPDRL